MRKTMCATPTWVGDRDAPDTQSHASAMDRSGGGGATLATAAIVVIDIGRGVARERHRASKELAQLSARVDAARVANAVFVVAHRPIVDRRHSRGPVLPTHRRTRMSNCAARKQNRSRGSNGGGGGGCGGCGRGCGRGGRTDGRAVTAAIFGATRGRATERSRVNSLRDHTPCSPTDSLSRGFPCHAKFAGRCRQFIRAPQPGRQQCRSRRQRCRRYPRESRRDRRRECRHHHHHDGRLRRVVWFSR
jgi:hypothetical protein